MLRYTLLSFLLFASAILTAQKLQAKVYVLPASGYPLEGLSADEIARGPVKEYSGVELRKLKNSLRRLGKGEKDSSVEDMPPRIVIDVYKNNQQVFRLSMDNWGYYKYKDVRYLKNEKIIAIVSKIIGLEYGGNRFIGEPGVPNIIRSFRADSLFTAKKLHAEVYVIDFILMPESGFSEEEALVETPKEYSGIELRELDKALHSIHKNKNEYQGGIDIRILIDVYHKDKLKFRVCMDRWGVYKYKGVIYEKDKRLIAIISKIVDAKYNGTYFL